jgi:hypothetical protein
MSKNLIPLIAVAALAAGCGSADERETARAAAAALGPQAVVDDYRAAIIGGEGSTACGLLDARALRDVEADGSDCAARLGALAELHTPEDTAALMAMHPRARVHGARAVARLRTLGGDPARIVLVKGARGWRVSDSPELVNVRISNGR